MSAPRLPQAFDGGEWWIISRPSGMAEALLQRNRDLGRWTRLMDPEEASYPVSSTPAGVVLIAPSEAEVTAAGQAIRALQKLSRCLKPDGNGHVPSLAIVARLDGGFGLNGFTSCQAATQAAWWGLGKTLAREWTHTLVRTIDLDATLDDFTAADLLADELGLAGPLETGITATSRYGVNLVPVPAPQAIGKFGPEEFFLVTGGARGVTAAAALALAASGVRRFLLLGRSPSPNPESDCFAGVIDEARLKQLLLSVSKSRLSPRELQGAFDRLLADREIRATLQGLRAAGAEVEYVSADVTEAAAVKHAVQSAAQRWGPITGLVHGAGVLADRRLEDLRPEDLAAVYSTKVAGFENVWAAIQPENLRYVALFSSITARVGRAGQAAYAMANEVLNKKAQFLHQQYPRIHVQALNWGPWAGGMVRGGLRNLFHKEGVGLIPMAAGAALLVEELLAQRQRPAELVIRAPVAPATKSTVQVSVHEYPLLADHCLRGRPVVPFALALSWLVQQATATNAALPVVTIEDAQVLKGITLATSEILEIHIRTQGKGWEMGTMEGPAGWRPRVRAQVLVRSEQPASAVSLTNTPVRPADNSTVADYHRELFHGPAWQTLGLVTCNSSHIWARATRPGAISWLGVAPWVWWLDAVFQSMIVWTQRNCHLPSLPAGFSRLTFMQPHLPVHQVEITALVQVQGSRVVAQVEVWSGEGHCISRIENCTSVMASELRAAFHPSDAAAAS